MATRKKLQTPPGLKGVAYEVWLAGLGALNLAGEEGGRLFKALVEKGRDQNDAAKEKLSDFAERVQDLKGDARTALSKVTGPLEDGLAVAMQRLGVPTRKEIVTLTHRVEELTRHVGKAKAAAPAKPRPKAKVQAKPKPRPKAKVQAKPAAKPRTRAKASEKATQAVTV